MKYYLYKIKNKVNGKIYIGQTQNLARRFKRYRSLVVHRNVKFSMPIMRAIRKYGIKQFQFTKLAMFATRSLVNVAERKAIKYWRCKGSSYNVADGGLGGSYKGHCGHRQTHLTKDWKLNISKGCKGVKKRPFSLTHRQNISKAMKGRTLSVLHRYNVIKAIKIRWKLFGKKGFGR